MLTTSITPISPPRRRCRIADVVEKRLELGPISPKVDAGLARLSIETEKRRARQLEVFADACGVSSPFLQAASGLTDSLF